MTALRCQVRQAPSYPRLHVPHPRQAPSCCTFRTRGYIRGERTPSETGHCADSSKAVGIGIIFDAGESGAGPGGDGLVVNGLAPTGPAARSGKILLGDLLCTVDGMDVKGIAAGVRPPRPLLRVAPLPKQACL